jgi:diguanylate cyclase (GGDEF)-like protein
MSSFEQKSPSESGQSGIIPLRQPNYPENASFEPTYPWEFSPVFQQQVEIGKTLVKRLLELQELKSKAGIDELTGWPTKANFLVVAEQRLQADPALPCAIVFLDLRNFKAVNDLLPGKHADGDQVLIEVSNRIKDNTRHQDVHADILARLPWEVQAMGRLGGDEFAILVDLTGRPDSDLSDEEKLPENRLATFVNRLGVIEQEYLVARPDLIPFNFGFTVGVAMHKTHDSAEQTLNAADQDMSANKVLGRNIHGSYRPSVS